MILQDNTCYTAVVYSTAVEDITYAEICAEFVLESLASRSSVCLISCLVACDKEIIEIEVVSRICIDPELVLVACLGSCVSTLELGPLACLYLLGIQFNSSFLACFSVDSKKCEVELLSGLTVYLNTVGVLIAAEEVKSL